MRKIIFWANMVVTVSVVGFIIVFQQLAKVKLYGTGSILDEWAKNLSRLLGYATTDDARAWLIFFEQAQSFVREYGLLLILLVSVNGLVTSFMVRKYLPAWGTKKPPQEVDEDILKELDAAVATSEKASQKESPPLKLVPASTKPTESFWERHTREKEERAERARAEAAVKAQHDELKEKRATLARTIKQYEKDKKGSMFTVFPETEKQISALKDEIEVLEKELFPDEALSA